MRKKTKSKKEIFYKQNKRKIIDGLVKEGVPLNQVKKVFFANVYEEMKVNDVKLDYAMKKVLRSRTFTPEAESFQSYKEDIINLNIKNKRETKKYLGLRQNIKMTDFNWQKTSRGWELIVEDKGILLKRKPDTKTEGWDLLYI